MADYRLDNLSPRTFEHLIQALSIDSIASTIIPFGDGPDGGREATFNGPTHYGSSSSPWNGYGVVQAKFLQRPKSPKSDGQWIINELKKELRKYERRRRKARDLDYYILATNVTLTAAEDAGSKDAIIAILDDFVAQNKLRGYDIWDYDKLRILIDSNEPVRRAYAAWITPGDVLMQLSEWLKDHRPDYHRLVINYLQKELLSDQYAKLEQAGHTADEAIPLAQVFVDLPIANRSYAMTERSRPNVYADELPHFVSFMIKQAANRLVQSSTSDELDSPQGPLPGRFVLIGGPGQGKTTLGQYVCQIFRSSLLQNVAPNLLYPDVRRVVETFKSKADSDPSARRLPLRVVLSDFAAALAEKRTPSLVAYLAESFSRRTNSTLTAQQFQALIAQYPSLLVLDGLDEVPASSNREQVLAAVQDFSIDVTSCGMDMLILATSRPQGYNEDFSPQTYDHRWLVPLPPEKALEYGKKLAEVRFAGDTDRVAKIVGRLRRAARTPATARIMRSPLQVTILTLLVDRRGQLPQERWALFDEYYSLIYQRETEREIPAAAILREKKDDIDAVHRLVGLLLQVESEKSGRTDARLTTAQFSEIVERYLASEGNEGETLTKLRDAIIEGAANRLVFLVGLESGEVGFEIRSLQEFMAAEGLLDADDGLVQNRLRAVAGNSNWRNVTLFATGKVFSERRYLRDTIESICVELNEDTTDPASRLVFAGSELALDLLEDGPVARQPAKSRSLTRLAMRLLELYETTWPRRVAAIYQETTRDIFEEELARALESPRANARRNAWICLTSLIEAGVDHMSLTPSEALSKSTPDGVAATEMMLTNLESASSWLTDVMTQTLPAINPGELGSAKYHSRAYMRRPARRRPVLKVNWLNAVWESVFMLPMGDEFKTLRIVDPTTSRSVGEASLLQLNVPKRRRPSSVPELPADCHPAWEVIKAAIAFIDSPSSNRLADTLRVIASISPEENFLTLLNFTPWPLTECILAGLWDASWSSLIESAGMGLLGDRSNWEEWENKWLTEGLSLSELCSDVSQVIDSETPCLWFPLRSANIHLNVARRIDNSLIEQVIVGKSNRVRQTLAAAYASSFRLRSYGQRIDTFPPGLLEALKEVASSPSWPVLGELMAHVKWSPPLDDLWASAFAKGGLAAAPVGQYLARGPLASWLVSAIQRYPSQYGLLVCLAHFAHVDLSVNDVHQIALLPLDDTPPIVRMSRAIILLRAGRPLAEVRADVDAAFSDKDADAELLFQALISEDIPVSRQIGELLVVRELAVGVPAREASALSALRTCLRRRQSALIDEQQWVELGFMSSFRDVMKAP